ncbi:MAG TPA: LamG-like jellyroll fold domain-containing protein [Thermoanaerobaculia bacterium]|nr:LamG-like jellyroll fold domain-containing protein [Thermoanaerobaculia bacterium]
MTFRLRGSRISAVLALTLGWGLLACAPGAGEEGAEAGRGERSEVGSARLGEGFLVWESNRTGDWRSWYRRLDGSGLRQLSPEEGGGRQHCCPHISPDGRRVVYLSAQPAARDRWPEGGPTGPLHLIGADGEDARVVVPDARTYGDGRAAVWVNERELSFIGPTGHTELLDVESGARRRLTRQGMDEYGLLIDATFRHATTALPTFSPFDRETGTAAERTAYGGCEPYFSHDGRWGFFIAGAGGPIHKIDLASREVSPLVAKWDPALPADQGYLYFPMLARSGQLLAFGASGDEHDHFRGSYDVFVVETDPETLERLGEPVRMTSHPATDRFPDVFLAPLPLGRHFGEAPFAVALEAPAGGEWHWRLGDGTETSGRRVEHVYEEPGTYAVTARRGERELRGRVVARPGRPPRPGEPDLRRRGLEVVVPYDEPVRIEDPEIRFASGRGVAAWRAGDDGRSLVVEVAERIDRPDRLHLGGAIFDRAARPHRMAPAELEIAPPLWPTGRDDLVFQWRTGDAPNQVFDTRIEQDRACTLEAAGRARLDHAFRMVLGDGTYRAEQEAAAYVVTRCEAANQVTFQAMLAPGRRAQGTPERPAWILSYGQGTGARNLALGQAGRRLVLRVRTRSTGRDADRPQLDLFELPPGRPTHVAVTYEPGLLRVYLDGGPVLETEEIQGGLGQWGDFPLVFGDDARGGHPWDGTLEGVAFHARVLSPEELREDHLRYGALLEARPEVPSVEVRARLVARSDTPTLREISPYRRALFVFEYEVEEVLRGTYGRPRIRVAHWAILDGETQAVASARPGRSVRLVVEPFDANPQLEAVYLADTLETRDGLPLFYAVRAPPG